MSITTVTLEPRDPAAAARSLRAEFERADLSDVKTVERSGAIHVEMPIDRLGNYQFACNQQQCSWRTPKKKVVLQLESYSVEHWTSSKAFHMVLRSARRQSTPANRKTSPIRKSFFERALRAIEELQELNEERLAEAVQASSDYSVLLSALNTEEALASIRVHDPLAGARLRGLEAKRKLIEAEGGALSGAQLAKELQITRQAVDKRRQEGKLLAVELGKKGYRYPGWQIGLPHLDKVLDALGDRDDWERLAFFLNPSPLLRNRTPLEILRKRKRDIGDVLRAASEYGEQGA